MRPSASACHPVSGWVLLADALGRTFLIMSENETLVVSKDDEIRDLKRTLENTRDQLSKSLDVVVSLSIRNVELTNELKTLTSNAL
jgi:hypothetical protein